MIGKVIELKLRTVFSLPLLVFFIFIAFISTVFAIGFANIPPQLDQPNSFDIVFPISIFSSFLLGYTLFPRSILITKSDLDFLFQIPLDDKDFLIATTLAGFIINYLYLSFLVIFLALIMHYYGFLFLIIFSLDLTFLSNLLYLLTFWKRLPIAIILVLWFVSSYFDFPLSPFSIEYGNFLGFYLFLIFSLLLALLLFKYFSLSNYVNTMLMELGGQRGSVKSLINLSSSSPFMAMLKKNLNLIEIGGRTGGFTGGQYSIARVKIYYLTLGVLALAIAYYFVADLIPIFSFYFVLIEFFLNYSIAQASFINEPFWINLTIMSPIEFVRRYFLSKLISLYIVFIPLPILAFIMGNYNEAIAFLIIPLTFIIMTSLLVRYYPATQQSMQNDRITFSKIILSYVVLGIGITISVLAVYFPFYTLIGVIILDLPFFISQSFWEKAFERNIRA
ncbi:hypothetical protein SJAV_08590 [Sulfurisphaera javensis]|uniref:Uncharacterized protein n=1 Tax=Sulfurisphaera javensis TaxID=2049879 RepID=A0AAT9GQ63_9CREN